VVARPERGDEGPPSALKNQHKLALLHLPSYHLLLPPAICSFLGRSKRVGTLCGAFAVFAVACEAPRAAAVCGALAYLLVARA
jgi:hypothetical protein